jgi:hypothetical protein
LTGEDNFGIVKGRWEMLSVLIGTAGLADIYEKVVALKEEVKSTNTCDMDKSFETLAEYIKYPRITPPSYPPTLPRMGNI